MDCGRTRSDPGLGDHCVVCGGADGSDVLPPSENSRLAPGSKPDQGNLVKNCLNQQDSIVRGTPALQENQTGALDMDVATFGAVCGSSSHMKVVGPRSLSAFLEKETCFTTIWRHFIGSGRSQAVWISPGPEEHVCARENRPRKSPLISYRSPVISGSSNWGGRLRWTRWLIDG